MAQSAELRESQRVATETFDKVIADFRELTTKFDELVSSGSASMDQLRDLRDEANTKVSEAKALVKNAASEARQGAVDVVRYAAAASNDYVHDNPWSTASVAGAIGLLLGLLLGRRT